MLSTEKTSSNESVFDWFNKKSKKESDTESSTILFDLYSLLDDNVYAKLEDIKYNTTVNFVKFDILNKMLLYVSKIDLSMTKLYNDRSEFPYNLINEIGANKTITDVGSAYLKKLINIFNDTTYLVKHKVGTLYNDIDNFDIIDIYKKFDDNTQNDKYTKYKELVKLRDGLAHASNVVEIFGLDKSQWCQNSLGYLIISEFKQSGLPLKITGNSNDTSIDAVNHAITGVLNMSIPCDDDMCLKYIKILNNNISTANAFEEALLNYCRTLVLYGAIWNMLNNLIKDFKPIFRAIYINVKRQLNLGAESLLKFGYELDPMSRSEQLQLEQDITEINGLLLIRNGAIVGSSEVLVSDIGKHIVNISKFLYNTSINLYKFARDLKDFIANGIVSEQRINDRCAMLLDAIKNVKTKRAYVKNVPSLQVQRTRFLNLIKVVEYIETSASYSPDAFPPGDTFIENIAKISGDLLIVTRPSEGSTFKNLEWNEPELSSYEITQSPWANEANVNQIKALAITCKYDMADKLKNAALIIAKKCDVVKKNYTRNTTPEEDSMYGSYDSEMASIYTVAYMVSKAVKQVLKQGLQKEINTFTNTHIGRLTSFIYK